MRAEALADVVDRDRDANQGADGDKELSDGHDNPVQSVLHGEADETQTQRHQNEVGRP